MDALETNQSVGPHRLFNLPEMFSAIFERVYNDFKWLDTLHTLPKAARVCKDWMDPAFDWLWSRIQPDEIFPLLSPLRFTNHGWTFEKIPDNVAWGRFFFYAHRVRELVYEGYMFLPSRDHGGQYLPTIFSHEIFHHLAFAGLPESHHGRLLPNLRKVSWHSVTVDTLPQVFVFIKPGLRSIALSFTALRGQLESSLGLDLSPFERVVGRMRQVPGLAPRVLRLHISCHPVEPWHSPEVSEWLEQLSSVENLSLKGIGLSSLTITLGRLHQLRKLSLNLFWTSMEDASRILSTVAEGLPLMERLTVTLEVKRSEEDTWLESDAPFSTILPLTRLPELCALQLEFPSPIHLDPGDIAVMGTAWPLMQELVLSYRPHSAVGHTQCTKLSSLTSFAKAFARSLWTLKHCFLVDDTLPKPGGEHFSRITLDVGTSPLEVERAGDVVPFLKALFPHGVALKSGPKPVPPLHTEVPLEGWKKVSELMVADDIRDGVDCLVLP